MTKDKKKLTKIILLVLFILFVTFVIFRKVLAEQNTPQVQKKEFKQNSEKKQKQVSKDSERLSVEEINKKLRIKSEQKKLALTKKEKQLLLTSPKEVEKTEFLSTKKEELDLTAKTVQKIEDKKNQSPNNEKLKKVFLSQEKKQNESLIVNVQTLTDLKLLKDFIKLDLKNKRFSYKNRYFLEKEKFGQFVIEKIEKKKILFLASNGLKYSLRYYK